jgi:CBS domain-containing protein
MLLLGEIYERQITDAIFEGYYLVLQDMSDDEFVGSIKAILSGRKFASFPKPAEILDYSKPDLESIATIAWSDVERAIYKAGKYESVSFEDRIVNSVIDALGGWVFICSQDVSEIKWLKKEFVKLYSIHSKRQDHPTHLIGITERDNGRVNVIPIVNAGYVIQAPVVVPALNPARSVNDIMIGLSNQVRVS